MNAALGWPAKLADAAAIAFSKVLYQCLGDGLTLSKSVNLAAENSGSEEKPVLYTNTSLDPDLFTFAKRTEE